MTKLPIKEEPTLPSTPTEDVPMTEENMLQERELLKDKGAFRQFQLILLQKRNDLEKERNAILKSISQNFYDFLKLQVKEAVDKDEITDEDLVEDEEEEEEDDD